MTEHRITRRLDAKAWEKYKSFPMEDYTVQTEMAGHLADSLLGMGIIKVTEQPSETGGVVELVISTEESV